jgi:hypothetical protein
VKLDLKVHHRAPFFASIYNLPPDDLRVFGQPIPRNKAIPYVLWQGLKVLSQLQILDGYEVLDIDVIQNSSLQN